MQKIDINQNISTNFFSVAKKNAKKGFIKLTKNDFSSYYREIS